MSLRSSCPGPNSSSLASAAVTRASCAFLRFQKPPRPPSACLPAAGAAAPPPAVGCKSCSSGRSASARPTATAPCKSGPSRRKARNTSASVSRLCAVERTNARSRLVIWAWSSTNPAKKRSPMLKLASSSTIKP
eukprot:13609491-Alexandrium_andersonii.AAC.1